MAIVICGAGLAGSLVEQITGSAVVDESAASAAEDAFSFEPAKTLNETDANEVRFSIGQLMQRKPFFLIGYYSRLYSAKICEISAVSIGMIVGIIALFSGIVERKGTSERLFFLIDDRPPQDGTVLVPTVREDVRRRGLLGLGRPRTPNF